MPDLRNIMLRALERNPREPYTADHDPDWLQSAKTKMENRMSTVADELTGPYRALQKIQQRWADTTDEQKKYLMESLHDDFGLSLNDMRHLFNLTDGQMRYIWWKLCNVH